MLIIVIGSVCLWLLKNTEGNQIQIQPTGKGSAIKAIPNKAMSFNIDETSKIVKIEEQNSSHSVKPNYVKANYLLARQLGGWDQWIVLAQQGDIDISAIPNTQKNKIFRLVVSALEPNAINDLIDMGFEPTSELLFAAIASRHESEDIEADIIEKIDIISQYTGLNKNTVVYLDGSKASIFDRAVNKGYVRVLKDLQQKNIHPADPSKSYQYLIMGSNTTIEALEYLKSLGYKPPDNFKALANNHNFQETNPELYHYIENSF